MQRLLIQVKAAPQPKKLFKKITTRSALRPKPIYIIVTNLIFSAKYSEHKHRRVFSELKRCVCLRIRSRRPPIPAAVWRKSPESAAIDFPVDSSAIHSAAAYGCLTSDCRRYLQYYTNESSFALESDMSWFGADPGGMRNGEPCFGLAWLRIDGTFETDTTDCAYEAMKWMKRRSEPPGAVGIDCPLWWSSGRSAERQVDVVLRRKYRHRIGHSVQSINSLRGAALVQGVMLASLVRQQFPNMLITETHPKALLKAKHLEAQGWSHIASDFGFYGAEPKSDDRIDALVSAAVARNGSTNLWKNDLAELPRRVEEMDPQRTFFGAVNYYWFEKVSE